MCHLLSQNGGVRAEFTVYKISARAFYLVSAGAFERHDHDCLEKALPADGSARMYPVTTQYGVLVLAGPNSRAVLQKLTDTDLSNQNFKWLTGKFINLGAAQAHLLRVNFVGELGFELHHPIEMQNYIFDQIMAAGAEFDLKPFGIRAMDSMRLEKSYRLIPREMSIEYSALESGLDRFVRFDKESDFIGKQALTDWQARGFANAFVTLEVHGITDADARGSEAILQKRKTGRPRNLRRLRLPHRQIPRPSGWCSLPWRRSAPNWKSEILGKAYKATVIEESPYDPQNQALRA